MTPKLPKPLSAIGSRVQEMGRIRIGDTVTTAKKSGGTFERPVAIDTFRLTSPNQTAIEVAADVFGGTAMPWHNERATPNDQWQVTTTTNRLKIFLPQNTFTIHYERWNPAAGGLERRCDGVVCVQSSGKGDAYTQTEVDCLCEEEKELSCKIKGRFAVVLPDLPFGGTWRLESGSENMAAELPAMQALIADLQVQGMTTAQLVLEPRKTRGGRSTNYVVKVEMDQSPAELLAGRGTVAALSRGADGQVSLVRELEAPKAEAPWDEDTGDDQSEGRSDGELHPPDGDEGIAEAELVHEDAELQALAEAAVAASGELVAPYDLIEAAGDDAARKLQGIVDGQARISVRDDGSIGIVKAT